MQGSEYFSNFSFLSRGGGHAGDVGVGAFVPVEEAFHVDLVADGEVLHGVVNVGGVVAQVGFNGEGVGVTFLWIPLRIMYHQLPPLPRGAGPSID